MLHKRIVQFLVIYGLGLAGLLALKYTLGLSDYVIPPPNEIWQTARTYAPTYCLAVLNTLAVAVLGHVLSIALAVGGRRGRPPDRVGRLVHPHRCLQCPGVPDRGRRPDHLHPAWATACSRGC